MRGFMLGLSISLAFIAGAVFAQWSSEAFAQGSGRSRWEYFCVEKLRDDPGALAESFSAGGAKGWELAAAGEVLLGDFDDKDRSTSGVVF